MSVTKQENFNQNNHIFSDFIEQFSQDIYRFSYSLCGNTQIAEDVAQETMLRAWKSAHKISDLKAVKSWLFTIARRENARRFERKTFEYVDFPETEIKNNKADYDTSVEAHVLRNALKSIPSDYLSALLLKHEYGYSQKEIGKILGISTAGAGTRLFRARKILKDLVEK